MLLQNLDDVVWDLTSTTLRIIHTTLRVVQEKGINHEAGVFGWDTLKEKLILFNLKCIKEVK